MLKNRLLGALFTALLLSLLLNIHTASADEISGHGHEIGLRYLITKNALEQSPNGSYMQNKTVTRGEFAHYLSTVLNLQGGQELVFSDVAPTHKYTQSIQRAAAAGIITGYIEDGTFKPNDAITRQHMAIMLDRVMDYLKMERDNKTLTFKDANLITEQYRQAVANGASLGIIQGDNGYFMPQKNATIAQSATFIHRLMRLHGDPQATIPTYVVQEIINGKLIGNQTFTSFNDAQKAMTKTTHVIVQNDNIVKMNAGYVVTNKYVALQSETIQDQIAVAANSEMEYLGSDETTVKVKFAGHVGTLKQADANLIPFSMSKGRSYYTNENNELKHVIYNHATGKYSASFNYGKAPDFMKKGSQYYSWNSIHFTNSNGTLAGESYNYYQFLPARSTTNYSANEIDQYIMARLFELEKTNLPLYKDATTKSKLIGLGETLKEVEAQYNINAMLILALAQHESAYGMSDQAQDLNNLFGLYVYDTNPLNKHFESVMTNINELIIKFWQPNYITPTGPYAHGAVVGSKSIGFNVKYASDPFWGEKIAGHYYRAEKEMGFKDAKNPYTIGLTTTPQVHVNTVINAANSTPFFTYKRAGMPVIITNSSIDGVYEINSDRPFLNPVYVNKNNVKIIQTVK